jgi:hypothetical protein
MTTKSNSTKPTKRTAARGAREIEKDKEPESELAGVEATSERSPAKPTDEEIALAKPTPEFANGKELAKAIAQQCDLVAVGSKLLRDGEAKGASVRARMFETTVEYLYGKPAPAPAPEVPPVRVILDIPRPFRGRIPG